MNFTSKYGLLIIFVLLFIFSNPSVFADENPINLNKMQSGYQAFKSICSTCHTQSFERKNRIAPPISKVKQQYLHDSTNFNEFRNALISFINEPSSNVKMLGAKAKFGAMPKLLLDNETIADIAYYIYNTPLEDTSWNQANAEANALKYEKAVVSEKNTNHDYKKHGLMLAMQTKSALGSQLKKALAEKGTDGAVEFCNLQAITITNNMSTKLNANITRVSDRPRNPINLANAKELDVMATIKNSMKSGEKPMPHLKEDDGKMIGYYPIVTNAMCLGCHGDPKQQINLNTLSVIKRLYPNDKAFGYDSNQLRGLFVVEMEKD